MPAPKACPGLESALGDYPLPRDITGATGVLDTGTAIASQGFEYGVAWQLGRVQWERAEDKIEICVVLQEDRAASFEILRQNMLNAIDEGDKKIEDKPRDKRFIFF